MSDWKKGKVVDSIGITSARRDVYTARDAVRACPHCTEGWRDTGKGFTRCECWVHFKNAWDYLRNLDPDFFVGDLGNLKSCESGWGSRDE